MGFFEEFVDLKREYSGTVKNLSQRATNSKSITRWSKNAVFQFPVLTSKSLDMESVALISRALEKNYAVMVNIIVNLMNVQDDDNIEEYLKRIHQNIDLDGVFINNSALHSKINENLKPIDESFSDKDVAAIVYDKLNKDIHQLSELNASENVSIKKSIGYNTALLEDVLSDSGLRFVNIKSDDQDILSNLNSISIEESSCVTKYLYNNVIIALDETGMYSLLYPITNETQVGYLKMSGFKLQRYNNKSYKLAEADIFKINKRLAHAPEDIFERKILNEAKKSVLKSSNTIYNNNSKPNNNVKSEISDVEIKKANELIPTTIEIHVKLKNSDLADDTPTICNCVIGVKTLIHPVDSDAMIENLANGFRENRKFFDFIRWTSGEISFFKDFLFGVKTLKNDALNIRNGNSFWWTMLKRRKDLADTTKFIVDKQILPNATILLSAEEAAMLKNEYGTDIMDNSVAKKLMSTFFLISIVIADPNNEIVRIFYDGDIEYRVMSYSDLKRETNNSNQVADIMKVLGRY